MEADLTERRVVVLGGCGNFGSRICRRLSQEPDLEVIATARTARDGAPAGVTSARLDIDSPSFAQSLAVLKPYVVIHCAGPFPSGPAPA
jgi:nucleoside-diphosphate-sugar epimerase